MSKELPADIVTVLYEVGGQQYIIGVTKERIPWVAAIGVNTSRPLPQNVRKAFVENLKELMRLEEAPEVVDYNALSKRYSASLLGNFSIAPGSNEQPTRTVEEAIELLEAKMRKR